MFSPSSDIIPCHPYFLIGIICGPILGSFPVRDHLRFNLPRELVSLSHLVPIPVLFSENFQGLVQVAV